MFGVSLPKLGTEARERANRLSITLYYSCLMLATCRRIFWAYRTIPLIEIETGSKSTCQLVRVDDGYSQ